VLGALGVVKTATAAQLRQLTCPGTASEQTVRNGLLNLAVEGLVLAGGAARRLNDNGVLVAQKLWHLTPAGLEAAAAVLGRPAKEMGSTARGAAASGAKHAVRVTDTIDAFLQVPAEPTSAVVRKDAAPRPRRELPVRPRGLGTIGRFHTEVVLPVTGTASTPGRGSPRADAVLTAPDQGLPLLYIEVDNGTEGPAVLAEKIAAYRRFGRRSTKDTDGCEVPLWQTMFPSPADEGQGHPPLALVFTKAMGESAMWNRIRQVADLSASCWQPRWISPGGPLQRSATATSTTPTPCPSWPPPWPPCASTARTGRSGGASHASSCRPSTAPWTTPHDHRAYEERLHRADAERQEQERRREAQQQREMQRWEKEDYLARRTDRVEELVLMWDNPHRIDLRE
jgi:hypothetical protein